MNTAGTSVIPEVPVMRVVKSEIRNFRLELRSRDPKFEMEERSSLPASQRPSGGNSKLSRPDPQLHWVRPGRLIEASIEEFIAHWQVKRDGSKRGIVEVIP